ncbi:MAG: disulfide bond formation protein DsbC [Acidobacteria bacterium]|nr:disulfide bond formation protein DsbC [Acidobacteriota bacterium]MBV9147122.1 disulfide bond formation protein DsbC [Acidobacteriota bacterium]MBV9437840.1 disulfide bond formation protein DsbC [Acidobacteriota bacterium]
MIAVLESRLIPAGSPATLRTLKSFALALFLLIATIGFAADEPKLAHVYVTFEGSSAATIVPGRPTAVDLHFKVKDGFHVNSNKPKSELLIPTVLKLDLPTDLAAGGIVYPVGKDVSFPFDPSEKLNVYTGDFTVKAKLAAAHAASAGNFTVHGSLRYQACSDNACYPPRDAPVQFDVHVSSAASRAHRGNAQSPHIK